MIRFDKHIFQVGLNTATATFPALPVFRSGQEMCGGSSATVDSEGIIEVILVVLFGTNR